MPLEGRQQEVLDQPPWLPQGVVKDKPVGASPGGVVKVRAHTRTPEAGKRRRHRPCPFCVSQHKERAQLNWLQFLAGKQPPEEPPWLDDSDGQDVGTPWYRQCGKDQLWDNTV